MVEAILICGAIYSDNLFHILEIAEIKVVKKANYCFNINLVFPILSILIDISVVIIEKCRKETKLLSMLKKVQFGREIFTLSPVA